MGKPIDSSCVARLVVRSISGSSSKTGSYLDGVRLPCIAALHERSIAGLLSFDQSIRRELKVNHFMTRFVSATRLYRLMITVFAARLDVSGTAFVIAVK